MAKSRLRGRKHIPLMPGITAGFVRIQTYPRAKINDLECLTELLLM